MGEIGRYMVEGIATLQGGLHRLPVPGISVNYLHIEAVDISRIAVFPDGDSHVNAVFQ